MRRHVRVLPCGIAAYGRIRLAEPVAKGEGTVQGKLEVAAGSVWRRICPTRATHREAAVVCRMLGYPHGRIAASLFDQALAAAMQYYYDPRVLPICLGSEGALAECLDGGFFVDYESCNGQSVMIECSTGV